MPLPDRSSRHCRSPTARPPIRGPNRSSPPAQKCPGLTVSRPARHRRRSPRGPPIRRCRHPQPSPIRRCDHHRSASQRSDSAGDCRADGADHSHPARSDPYPRRHQRPAAGCSQCSVVRIRLRDRRSVGTGRPAYSARNAGHRRRRGRYPGRLHCPDRGRPTGLC